jgi:hypothetical protein
MTHPSIFKLSTRWPPSQIAAWLETPTLALLEAETVSEPPVADLEYGRAPETHVNDARIAISCLRHQLRVLGSVDPDFGASGRNGEKSPTLGSY